VAKIGETYDLKINKTGLLISRKTLRNIQMTNRASPAFNRILAIERFVFIRTPKDRPQIIRIKKK